MKTLPMLLLFAAAFPSIAQPVENRGTDTNELTTAITELQRQVPAVDVTSLPMFVNASDREARLALAAQRRQELIAAREKIPQQIEPSPTGAIARFGALQVSFGSDALNGIVLVTPDGLQLRSRVVGLCYWSESKTVMLAELKRSTGQIVDAKTVRYPEALGAVAEIVYEVTSSSFEQNIVIRKQLPTPAECGFAENENVRLAVVTEFFDALQPRRTPITIDLREAYRSLGMQRDETLPDETLSFGAVRIIAGKSFSLGEPDLSVPSGKAWQVFAGPGGGTRRYLIESTPYRLLKPLLDALPVRTALLQPKSSKDLKTALAQLSSPSQAKPGSQLMARVETSIKGQPGVVLDYLLVSTRLLNIDFGAGNKSGFAAFGQQDWDCWNAYSHSGYEPGWLSNLYWSDSTPSTVGIIVTNGAGLGANTLCLDPMYQDFIHPQTSGSITVVITNLLSDEYDLVVYATRASGPGAPSFELKRAGTSLSKKGTTIWGDGWYSSAWAEGDQYVRFRRVAVTNQTLQLIAFPDSSGYASLSGLQIIPSSSLPSEQPAITQLLNVDLASYSTNKVGSAAVGLGAQDFWNGYVHSYAYAAVETNLRWSDQTTSSVGMIVRNAPGAWGYSTLDPMMGSFVYSANSGDMTILFTNLPAGICDVYLYGHGSTLDDCSIFELWSDQVSWGVQGTSRIGYGPLSNYWEVGQQYVRFPNVTISNGAPLVIHSKHNTYGYDSVSGIQIAYTGDADTDADGLPDGWERKWFGDLSPTAAGDPDGDGLSNLREYRLGLDPGRYDSDGDGIVDWQDNEFPWLEDAVPQGGITSTSGGDNWTWVSSWTDGVGWNGGTVTPHSGQKMVVSANTTNTMHQHAFDRSVAVLRPGTDDVLYAWVNLDPAKLPSEVMLEFYTLEDNGYGSWHHRAYWGSNLINSGTNNTASRYPMGSLPASNQWVRLEVPASAVGLEGRIIEGMAFTLYSGRAAWDNAGIVVPDMDGDGVVDIDADGMPDSWELAHFGNLSQSGDGDYDSDGISNVQEFLDGTDPNTIWFSTHYDDLYVTNRSVNGTSTILGGVPQFMTVLVNSTNLAGATWQPFSTNFSATLPDQDATHTVLLALRGRTLDFSPSCDETEITLDRVPPLLLVTNPSLSTVSRPYVQLQGLANEPVAVMSYDLVNAAGTLTNEPAFVVDQYFDTNCFDFTTNYFQAYDVELTNGVNAITLTAVDLAGNVSQTNLNVTLSYAGANNPPTLSFLWPTNGSHLSGNDFYIRGQISDETASVTARQVDAGGNTNDTPGLVERNGMFWVENLALADGTNVVTLLARDAAGNLSSTNLQVVKSSVIVTITSMPEGEELNQPFGTVYGTVSDPSYNVFVNGVAAVVDASGYWLAENVPIPGFGTATFDVIAIPAGGGVAAVMQSAQAELPPRIEIVEHKLGKIATTRDPWGNTGSEERVKSYKGRLQSTPASQWERTFHGAATDLIKSGQEWTRAVYEWTGTNRSTHHTDSFGGQSSSTNIAESYTEVTGVPDQDLTELGTGGAQGDVPTYIYHYYARNVRHAWPYLGTGEKKAEVNSRTKMHLYTGGKAGVKRKSLIHIKAHAHEYSRPPDGPWLHTPTTNIPPNRIKVFGWCLFGRQIDPWGDLYIVLPDNAEKDLNLRIPGFKHYGAWAEPEKIRLEVNSVSFQGHQEVFRDDGSGSYPGLWFTNDVAATEQGYPLLYVSGDRVKTFTIFRILGGGTFPLRIRGKVSGGSTSFTLEGTNDTSGLTMLQVDTVADECLTPNRVDFFNPMTIRWQYAYVNSSDFLDAGRSTNQVYVTLRSPLTGVPLYHTVVHLSCMNAVGKTTDGAAADAIYAEFTDREVRRLSDNSQMTYWFNGQVGGPTTAALLQSTDANGNCEAWSAFLRDCFSVQGISADRIKAMPVSANDRAILVKNWQFNEPPHGSGTHPYIIGTDAVHTDGMGIPAQGNPNPPDHFNGHWITLCNDAYYDPSYGTPKVAGVNKDKLYEDGSLDGFGNTLKLDLTGTGGRRNNTSSSSVSELYYTPDN